MTTLNSETINGYCLFADESRVEDTGKDILVGLYHSHLIVPVLPSKIDRLFCILTLRMRSNIQLNRIKLEATISKVTRVILDEEVEFKPDSETTSYFTDRRSIEIKDLEFTTEDPLVVTADFDGYKIEVGRLDIKVSSPVDTNHTFWGPLFYYASMAQTLNDAKKAELAKTMIELMMPASSAPPPPIDEDLLVPWLKKNIFRVFFAHPRSDDSPYDVIISDIKPEPQEYVVTEKARYSCVVRFDPKGKEVEEFDLSVTPL